MATDGTTHGWDDRDTQALDWAVRTGNPAFDEWEAFQTWLEADPEHGVRFHAVSGEMEAAAASIPVEAPRMTSRPTSPPRWRTWAGTAVAASVLGTLGFVAIENLPRPYAVETAAGTMRTVTLADGSALTLDGATRVMLDRHDPRVATLERGRVVFAVRHDAAHPFAVTVGGSRVVDVGTIFDIRRDRDATRVAVSEGAVDFDPGRNGVRLVAGQGLFATDSGGVVRVSKIDRDSVGGWREGRLDYDGAALSEVAGDLTRHTGVMFTVAQSVAGRSFRGTLRVSGVAQDPESIAPLLGVDIRRVGKAWELTDRP